MAGGSSSGRTLEQTPTWAVALVCLVLVVISIIIDHTIHLIGKWLKKKHERALYESLEKIKSELMLLGFISLLLTVAQGLITRICVSKKVGNTWNPCRRSKEIEITPERESYDSDFNGRKLFSLFAESPTFRQVMAGGGGNDKCAERGQVPFVSEEGMHQLHIFIFVLAVFHVFYSILTMALGRAKMRSWKGWEKETRTEEYRFSHDPERFILARDTSFGRRHLSSWTKTPILLWIVCFFRQFVRSVPKVDYLTLRHGFIMAHLAPHHDQIYDFQKYINRSLEEDFKVVVGISPPILFFAVIFILFNTHGWRSYLWLPFIPLIIMLLVGTKLQVIITKMALRIQERGEVVKGVPVVQPGDDLFWFNRPRLVLYLINFVLFQNSFQLAFFTWTMWQFGLKSCFHDHVEDLVIRVSMGVLVQILCSYVTLPLYALVIQMGSTMKPTIFSERVATTLRNWLNRAREQIKQNRESVSPVSSRPATPSHHTSPDHLRRHYCSEIDSLQNSPEQLNLDVSQSVMGSSNHPAHPDGSTSFNHRPELARAELDRAVDKQTKHQTLTDLPQHAIVIGPRKFSFEKNQDLEADVK